MPNQSKKTADNKANSSPEDNSIKKIESDESLRSKEIKIILSENNKTMSSPDKTKIPKLEFVLDPRTVNYGHIFNLFGPGLVDYTTVCAGMLGCADDYNNNSVETMDAHQENGDNMVVKIDNDESFEEINVTD